MKITTLIYVFNPEGQVLLCAKKKTNSGFTVSLGKWNGAGGKMDEGETIVQSAKRELEEETGIVLPEEAFEHRGKHTSIYENKPERNNESHVFVIKNYTGPFQETEELLPKWFNIEDIPYEKMWIDDAIWLPSLLAGEYIEYIFHLTEDGSKIIKYERIK